MKNVLVVGGAGYVGGGVTEILQDYNLKVYDNLLYEDSYRKSVDFVYGDIRDHEKLKPLLKWADVVIWFAAIVGDGACALNPDLTVELNDKSVQWLSQNFDGKIVFTSTCSVYGANNDLLDENSIINPLSLYAGTKLSAEKHLESSDALIFRLGTLFGISDSFSRIRIDLVVNTLTAKAHFNNEIHVFGGAQYRPLLHVRDIAYAIDKALKNDSRGTFNLHAVNLQIIDIAHMIKEKFPTLNIITTEEFFQDERNYKVSSDKASKEFGFSPKYSVEDGIIELKELIEQNRIKDVFHARHVNSNHLEKVLSENGI